MAELTIAHLTEAVQIEGIKSEKRDEKQISELATLNKSFAQYFKSMANQAGDKLEKEREKVSGKKPTRDEFSSAGQGFSDALDLGALGFVGAIGSALTGLVVGVTIGFGKYLSALAKTFDNLTGNKISAQMLKVGKSIRSGLYGLIGLSPNGKPGPAVSKVINFFSKIKNPFNSSFKLFESLSKGMNTFLGLGVDGKPVTGTSNFVKRLYKIGNIFKPLTSLFGEGFKGVGSTFKTIGDVMKSGISRFTGAFQTIGKTFGALRGALSPIFTVFKTLGRVIFAPLTLILSIVDGIKGAIAGFQEEGILGGILGAVGGVLGGLIGMPLDLLKSAISWIAGKLGFENFSEILDSFSFKDGIMDLFMGIANVFNGAIDWVKNAIGGVANKIASFFGFGGDEEEPEVKEIKEGKVVPKVENVPVKPAPQPKMDVQDDDFHEVRGTDEDGFNYTETKRTPKSEQDMMAAEEERYKRHLKINQERMVKYNEQGKGDSKGAMWTEERIMRLQAKLDELEAKQSAGNTVIAPSTTTNTTQSSNTAVYGDASPATDDLDRVA
jgi:hypothetical protein